MRRPMLVGVVPGPTVWRAAPACGARIPPRSPANRRRSRWGWTRGWRGTACGASARPRTCSTWCSPPGPCGTRCGRPPPRTSPQWLQEDVTEMRTRDSCVQSPRVAKGEHSRRAVYGLVVPEKKREPTFFLQISKNLLTELNWLNYILQSVSEFSVVIGTGLL